MSLMKTFGWTAVAGAAVLLAGCGSAPIPLAKNFPLTEQHKVRSAGHWELVARDVVTQTRAMVGGADAPMYVALPQGASAFDRGFREFLITGLVQSGASVHDQPGVGLEVSYNAQVVRHRSARPHFIPGVYTMLAGGVMAAYGLRHSHLDAQLAAGLGLAVAADYANSIYTGGPTNTELILTTTVMRDGQYVARKTDVYYLENADAPLFVRHQHYRPVNMKVVSK